MTKRQHPQKRQKRQSGFPSESSPGYEDPSLSYDPDYEAYLAERRRQQRARKRRRERERRRRRNRRIALMVLVLVGLFAAGMTVQWECRKGSRPLLFRFPVCGSCRGGPARFHIRRGSRRRGFLHREHLFLCSTSCRRVCVHRDAKHRHSLLRVLHNRHRECRGSVQRRRGHDGRGKAVLHRVLCRGGLFRGGE